MLDDSLTILTPTIGRDSLRNTLRSYAHQMGDRDEYLIMGDTHNGALPQTETIVKEFDQRFRYVPTQSTFGTWGHSEINAGIRMARNAWIISIDDDDIATPDALADIRVAIAEQPHPRPLFFQFMAPWRDVLWFRRELNEGEVGGHCLCQPNVPGKIAFLTPRYSGDFDYLVAASEHYAGDVAWIPKMIAWTRPTAAELRRLIPQRVLA